ncbi:MAG: formate dehydrogenase accessory sulfurtransferase FdhD [Planctomycetota bacterium]|nr:formate dehydrogenase accessory sulfurtransferase FdhD [Planctomycetota bacterium]MDA1113291.1 formate dehydrogenase accessory sulfurtransferase FdhD [Planctomycetota bacterium]
MTPDPPTENRAAIRRTRFRLDFGSMPAAEDYVASEEPLEIRIRGQAFAVLMRTPGRERDLVAGFLAAEGLIHHKDDVTAIEPCLDVQAGLPEPNIWNVALADGVAFDPRNLRQVMVSSSCGLCGARSLEDLQRDMPVLASGLPKQLSLSSLLHAFEQLRKAQSLFEATAGSHGVALWDPESTQILDVAEDVGRHNAVDKLLGAQLLADAYPAAKPLSLLISGRISFELVQKAALAGIPMLAGVGMPTSLAVDAARETGQVLLGWARDAGANLYAGELHLS